MSSTSIPSFHQTHVAIIGPEGSGKHILAQKLSEHYKMKILPSRGANMPDIIARNRNQAFVVLDYPRTLQETEQLATITRIHFVFRLETPLPVSIERQQHRFIHPASGRIYYTDGFYPPQRPGRDDRTNEPLVPVEPRSRERMVHHHLAVDVAFAPVAGYYRNKNRLTVFQNKSVNEMWSEMASIVEARVRSKLDEARAAAAPEEKANIGADIVFFPSARDVLPKEPLPVDAKPPSELEEWIAEDRADQTSNQKAAPLEKKSANVR